MTYIVREPEIALKSKSVWRTASRHVCRRRRLERLYDCIFQSLDTVRPVSHVATYFACNLHNIYTTIKKTTHKYIHVCSLLETGNAFHFMEKNLNATESLIE